jgi:hypothetical protein
MHFLPWALLQRGIKMEGPDKGPDTPVVMSLGVLKLLVEAALSSMPFDESAYLAANADVADAVRTGKCPGAQTHYAQIGYFENRSTGRAGFDEAWYLERNPDVQRAVRTGSSATGFEHFSGAGVLEWRSPNRAAEQDISRWYAAIERAPQPERKTAPPPAPQPAPRPAGPPVAHSLRAHAGVRR